MCTLDIQAVVDPRYTLLSPGLPPVPPYGITLEMCTLDTRFVVDPRYTLLSPGFFLDTLRCSLVLSYGISLEMCTLDTQTAVDPKYTSFPLVSSY